MDNNFTEEKESISISQPNEKESQKELKKVVVALAPETKYSGDIFAHTAFPSENAECISEEKSSKSTVHTCIFSDVHILPEESERFIIKNTLANLDKNLKNIHAFTLKIQRGAKDSLELQKIESTAEEIETVLQIVESQAKLVIVPARERGIFEGINGYRSLLKLMLRIIEKLQEEINVCPCLSKKSLIPSLPSLEKDSQVKKWSASILEFTKQLRLVGIMLSMAHEISESTDDLFLRILQKSQEEAILNMAMSLPTFSFFGIHFGSQYPSDIQKILKIIMIASTAHSTARKVNAESSWVVRGSMSLMYGAYYNFFPQEAAEKFVGGRANSDITELKEFWSLTENPFSEKASTLLMPLAMDYKLVLPPSKFTIMGTHGEMVSVAPPSLSPSMTLDFSDPLLPVNVRFLSYKHYDIDLSDVCRELRDKIRLKDYKDYFQEHISTLPKQITNIQSNFFKYWSTDSDKVKVNVELEPPQSIEMSPVGLSIHKNIQISEEQQPNISKTPEKIVHTHSFFGSRSKHEPVLSDSLIIHMHGGGFVAQTASSHMKHLSKWAKDTGAPIVTVDYRLAPEFPYPIALTECYYAYMWAIKNSRKLGSTGKRVVIVGDSAGGNLAAAVTMMAIVEKTRVPDGLILIYPATYMHFVLSPSRILSTIDPMLPIQTLKSCFVAYLPQGEDVHPLENPYLSPSCASKEILKQMPDKTYIMCGDLDPLLDDSIFMAKRLSSVGKPVKLKIYEDLPHGFINLGGVPGLGKEMWKGVKQVSEWMNEVFSS